MVDRLYSVSEVADMWGKCRRTILRLIKSGELVPVDTSTGCKRKTYGIPHSEIERFVVRRQTIAKPRQPMRGSLLRGEKRWY
jgi:hypothetical protein